MRKATQDKIPIAKCANPACGCTILYSKNPREKLKVAAGYVALPIIADNAKKYTIESEPSSRQ